ncbi:potassium channel family protein [Vibrio sp. S11_S32]|uniref:potassium channel family protein n=1 Tax=Vibrio sp. S11_S32 TaxID=2720225 RepID=UPI00168092A4|nr:potassium channel family protein [Vibrio sp. S11_S32]MBD1576868.1 potassium channel family protein [Vibrio sp. S11_S32]
MSNFYSDADFKPLSLMSLLLSIVSVILVSFLLFVPLPQDTRHTMVGIDTAICALFLFQLSLDCYRSKLRLRYLKVHALDFLASLPGIEFFRYIRLLHIIRIFLMLRSRKKIGQQILENRKEATVATIFTLLIILLCLGSSLMLLFEENAPNTNIHTAADALWWSIVTISTVGYGDHFPVTFAGKVLASVLIVCGVGIFGMISGLLASIIATPHDKQNAQYKSNLEQILNQQQQLLDKVDRLEQKIQRQGNNETPDNKKGIE